MKRPIVTLGLVGLLAFPMASACNQAETPDDEGGGNNTSGTGNTSAGSGGLVAPTAGSGQATAGTGNVIPTAGSGGSAPSTAGTSAGGSADAATAGSGGSAGTATGGSGGSAGGDSNPACPVKIDSAVMCSQVITCDNAYCGVFQMGSKDCSCLAATGPFECTPCDYTGRTEEIVLPPAAVLPACAADDMTLEKATPTCTKGDRCKSLTPDKNRFCACWESPADASLKWDCDSQPASWPK